MVTIDKNEKKNPTTVDPWTSGVWTHGSAYLSTVNNT